MCPRDKSSSSILFISLTAVLYKADAGFSSLGCSGVLHFDRTMSPHSHPQPFPEGAASAGISNKEGWLTLAFIIPRGSARTVLPAEPGEVNRGHGWTPWHADPQMCNQVQTTKPLRKCSMGFAGSARGTTRAFVLGLQPNQAFLWPVHSNLWFPRGLSLSSRPQPLKPILTPPGLSSLS